MVFKNLTYKKKNRLLAAGFVLLALMSYGFALKKTIALYRESIEMEKRLMVAALSPEKEQELSGKLRELEQRVGNSTRSIADMQQALLGMITAYCRENNTLLREFPKTISTQENNMLVQTNVFTVEGSFIKLLKLVYLLEQKNKMGKIVSAVYQKKRDLQTKTHALTVTIYLQNIKLNK